MFGLRFRKQPDICQKGEHENIDMIFTFPGCEARQVFGCKKCFLREELQDDDEYLEYRRKSEEEAVKMGWISDEIE